MYFDLDKLTINNMLENVSNASNDISQSRLVSEKLMLKCFVCIKCTEKHFSEELLLQHNMLHHSKYYHCFYCPFKSLKICFLLQHITKFDNHHQSICSVCSFESKNCFDLNLHLSSHNSSLPFVCVYCGLKFKYRRLWSKHFLGHSEKTSFSCDHCLEKFKTKYLRRMHELKMHPKVENKCEECGYSTRFPAYLKKHKLKHDGKFLQCSVLDCNFKTIHKESLKLHAISHKSRENLCCPECGINFNFEKNLKRHMLSYHTQQYTYRCTECDYLSERADKVKEHFLRSHDVSGASKGWKIEKHHISEKDRGNPFEGLCPFECHYCSKSFKSKKLLKHHILVIHSKLYHCLHCDFSSSKMFRLTEHINSNDNHNEAVCSYCLFEAKDGKDLTEHFLLHESPLPFVCFSCDSRYKTRSKWREHLRTHSGKLDILQDSTKQNKQNELNKSTNDLNRCHICEYVTKFPSYLKRHVSKHEKAFLHCTASDNCRYTTKHTSYMTKHLRRHEQQFSCEYPERSVKVNSANEREENCKKLTCPECGVTFNRKKNLTRHRESHSSKFVFSCARCSYLSPRQDKVREHCRKHHADFRLINIIKKVMKAGLNDLNENEKFDSSASREGAIHGMSEVVKPSENDSKVAGLPVSSPYAILIPLKDLETHLDEYTGILSFVYEITVTNHSFLANQESSVKGSVNSDEVRSERLNNVLKDESQCQISSSCEAGDELPFLNMNGSPCLQTLLDEVTGEITTLKEFPTQESTDSVDNLSDTMDFTCDIDFMNDDSFDGFDEFDDFIFETESNQGNSDSVIQKILNEETGELCIETHTEEQKSSGSLIGPIWRNVECGFTSENETVFSELFLDEVTGEFSLQT